MGNHGGSMYNYQRMVEDLKLMEKLAQIFEIEPFPSKKDVFLNNLNIFEERYNV
jgi:hypothetical protein